MTSRWTPDRWDDDGHPWRRLVGNPHPGTPTGMDGLPPVDTDDLRRWWAYAPNSPWRTATTMPYAPHQYAVRGQHLPEEDYVRLYALIVAFGEDDIYRGSRRVYLYSKDRQTRWWAMSDYLTRSKLINQARLNEQPNGAWMR